MLNYVATNNDTNFDKVERIVCVRHRNCAAKPAKLSTDSAEIEQRFRAN